MATQITMTDDVGDITTASNADGSIRMHMYTRPFGNGNTVYVRREVDGVLDAEVRLLAEGTNPHIFFDIGSAQWVLTYVLNEKLWMILFGEFDVPVTQPSQTGTIVDHHRKTFDVGNNQTTKEILAASSVGIPDGSLDSIATPQSVAITAGTTPGTNFTIRWVPTKPGDPVHARLAGFHVYGPEAGKPGSLVQLNGTLVPFDGFRLYELVVPAVPGRYYVTQVEYTKSGAGTSGRLVEGRRRGDVDTAFGDGLSTPAFINASRLSSSMGRGGDFQDQPFLVIDKTPIKIERGSLFDGRGPGESRKLAPEISVIEYGIVQLDTPILDTLTSRGPGEGFVAVIDIDQQGGIIIG